MVAALPPNTPTIPPPILANVLAATTLVIVAVESAEMDRTPPATADVLTVRKPSIVSELPVKQVSKW